MTHYQKARKIYNIIKNEEQPSLILQAAQEIYNGNFKAKRCSKTRPMTQIGLRQNSKRWKEKEMSTFHDRFGGLTVEQARELNRTAKLTCEEDS